MRAVYIKAHGGLEQLIYTTNYPDPLLSTQQVLVRVGATALNYHDIFTRRGMPGIKIRFPLITGSDIAGEIVEMDHSVKGWKPGDRVLIDPVCHTRPNLGMIGEMSDGGRAELVAVHSEQLIRLSDRVSIEQAACLPLAYGTAYRMMVTRGRVKSGEKVVILGASGGVGVACLQIGKLLGAEIVACSGSADKLIRLREFGANHLINYDAGDFRRQVYEVVGKPKRKGEGGADVVINFTGGSTWGESLKCLRVGGRLLTCGATAGYDTQTDMRYVWTFEQEILGSNGWTRSDLTTLLQLIADGRLNPVIDRVVSLSEAQEAERLMEMRQLLGKILIAP